MTWIEIAIGLALIAFVCLCASAIVFLYEAARLARSATMYLGRINYKHSERLWRKTEDTIDRALTG